MYPCSYWWLRKVLRNQICADCKLQRMVQILNSGIFICSCFCTHLKPDLASYHKEWDLCSGLSLNSSGLLCPTCSLSVTTSVVCLSLSLWNLEVKFYFSSSEFQVYGFQISERLNFTANLLGHFFLTRYSLGFASSFHSCMVFPVCLPSPALLKNAPFQGKEVFTTVLITKTVLTVHLLLIA